MTKPKEEKSINLPNEVIRDLLTPSEIRMLKNRWSILQLLEEGMTIRNIAERVKVGTDTVVRVSKLAEKNNLRVKRSEKKSLKSTPWVFGKSE